MNNFGMKQWFILWNISYYFCRHDVFQMWMVPKRVRWLEILWFTMRK